MRKTQVAILILAGWLTVTAAQAASTPGRALGTVKAVNGNNITVVTDSGPEVTVQVSESSRIVRAAPGQDLKTAPPMPLQELQSGDRVLARGALSDDGKILQASSLLVMKQADVKEKQRREREDWQKRGVGGLVSAVDASTGTISLATTTLAGSKPVAIHTTKDTVVRRYSPDSVKFDDATLSTLPQVKPGDQLRARGTRAPDGGELAAEEIVFGTFRNIAGTISSSDASNNTISVMDLATKKPVVVKITADSQLHKLPPFLAQLLARQLQGSGSEAAAGPGQSARPAGDPGPGRRPGGGGDLQQMLSRVPAVTLAELQKGDAVMIVATAGDGASQATAVTLLAGVEPILTAPNSSRAATILSPWNIGGGEAAAVQ